MNEPSQMGITIAGIAVVSAIAAVVFNKLNEEPRLSSGSSYARRFAEEKADDTYPGYESDEYVDPARRERARENESRRPKRDDDFGEPRAAPSAPLRESSFDSSSVPPRDFSFDSSDSSFAPASAPASASSSAPPRDSSFAPPRDSSFAPSSASSNQLNDYEEFDRPSDDFQSATDEPRSSSMVQRPSLGQPVQSSQGMLGGRGHTRCKHCHSRLRYTRRK